MQNFKKNLKLKILCQMEKSKAQTHQTMENNCQFVQKSPYVENSGFKPGFIA